MTTRDALDAMGAFPNLLSHEERRRLDEDGFLAIPAVLDAAQLSAIRDRLSELLAEEGDRAGLETHQEAGTDRLSDLVNKGDVFAPFTSTPKVLAAIAHVLGDDMKLSSLNARFAKPGEGNQALHADWDRLETAGDWQVCNSIWLLDDFTPENGATRVVPGSHRWGTRLPGDDMDDPSQPHPQQRLILGKAGDVVVFNSHTWHGGTVNHTDRPRRAMHSYWCRRNQTQQLDQRRYIRPETFVRMSPAERFLIDV